MPGMLPYSDSGCGNGQVGTYCTIGTGDGSGGGGGGSCGCSGSGGGGGFSTYVTGSGGPPAPGAGGGGGSGSNGGGSCTDSCNSSAYSCAGTSQPVPTSPPDPNCTPGRGSKNCVIYPSGPLPFP